MVVQDLDAMVGGELFEGAFGLDQFIRRRVLHQMDEVQMGVVVHKDGGAMVAVIGEFSF